MRALGSAPALTRAVTTSGVWLRAAAACSGVRPSPSRALGSAPALTRAVTTSRCVAGVDEGRDDLRCLAALPPPGAAVTTSGVGARAAV